MSTLAKIIKDLESVQKELGEVIENFQEVHDFFEFDEMEDDEHLNNFLEAWEKFKEKLNSAESNIKTGITFNNLQDMTAQESGIVIHNGDTIIICNWSGADNGIPILSPLGAPIKWDYGDWEVETTKYLDHIIDYIDGMDCIYDRNDDIETLKAELTGGILYVLDNGIQIIAPDGWN